MIDWWWHKSILTSFALLLLLLLGHIPYLGVGVDNFLDFLIHIFACRSKLFEFYQRHLWVLLYSSAFRSMQENLSHIELYFYDFYFWLNVSISSRMHKPSQSFHLILSYMLALEIFTSKVVLGLKDSRLRSQLQILQIQFDLLLCQITTSILRLLEWQFEVAKWISEGCTVLEELKILIFL